MFRRLAAALLLAAVSAALVSTAAAKPPAGSEWVAYEPMTDEFDGDELDRSKWFPRNPGWRGRAPVLFHPDCVSLRDGKLRLTALTAEEYAQRYLPNGFTHVSGYIRSKQPARFGYFEVRAKLMDTSLVSCFWLSEHTREEWSEIDICESPAGVAEYNRVIPTNTHYFFGPHYRGTPRKHLTDPKRVAIDFDATADFHTYGAEWDATHLRWYIDDKLVREAPNKWCFQPLRMSINVEANPYFGAVPSDDRLPAAYEIDWVRSWRRADDALN